MTHEPGSNRYEPPLATWNDAPILLMFAAISPLCGLHLWVAALGIRKLIRLPMIVTEPSLQAAQFALISRLAGGTSRQTAAMAVFAFVCAILPPLAFADRKKWVEGYNGEYAVMGYVPVLLAAVIFLKVFLR